MWFSISIVIDGNRHDPPIFELTIFSHAPQRNDDRGDGGEVCLLHGRRDGNYIWISARINLAAAFRVTGHGFTVVECWQRSKDMPR